MAISPSIFMRECMQCSGTLTGRDWLCHVCGFLPLHLDGITCLSPQMLRHNDGYNEALFSEYDRIVRTHFWFTGRLKLILDTMHIYCPAPASMLEIGCASGHVLEGVKNNFSNIRLLGSEPSILPLKTAMGRVPEVTFIQMDGRHIPFVNEFDLIGAFDVLEHIDEDELVLRQMFRACKNGGKIILTVPQHRWLWSKPDEDAAHKRRYSRQELLHKISGAGFEVRYVSSFMSLLLPAMTVSRALQRGKRSARSGQSPLDEGFKISASLNQLFSFIFTIERVLLSWGIRFPAGGSLLVVAQKKPSAHRHRKGLD